VDLVITEPRLLFQALQKYSPTILLAPPMFFEAIATQFSNLPPFKQTLLKVLHACRELIPVRWVKTRLTRVTARKLQEVLGGKVRLMITGWLPSSAPRCGSLRRLARPSMRCMGMTECGLIAWNTPGARRLGSVGKPLRNASVRIAEDGEGSSNSHHATDVRLPF